jgi:hypothetical protein
MDAGYAEIRLLRMRSVEVEIGQHRILSIDLPVAEVLIDACRTQIVRRLRQNGPHLLIGARRISRPEECCNTRDVQCCHCCTREGGVITVKCGRNDAHAGATSSNCGPWDCNTSIIYYNFRYLFITLVL